ncbi:class I SAM-dependent methyltransferase [Deinococcus koreensis]|uniref:Class I SAM-dependent methyltransferase n=1 Tax=Deinococcus koreensis TaxID=2054903 RepID=A0A2K3UYZ8_9DEIO|nr:class I SAM-dependent methyltransferase [Deinococcus koreensis]PNY81766.1 class I SAM-dependent methyltransferase [Deinococcus koreensis]
MREIARYYEKDREHDRLTRGLGQVEFVRTLDVLTRVLPPDGTLLDIGGGAGIYARELLGRGYRVHLLDAMPGHVERARRDETLASLASLTLGDARALPYPDAGADAALLLGPLYHLPEAADRATALAEARRVLRPGGLVCAAAIPRAAAICGDFTRGLNDEDYGRPIREEAYQSGRYHNPQARPGYFTTAYFHDPAELRAELEAAGFARVVLYALEGSANLLRDPEAVMADSVARDGLLAALRLTELDETLLSISAHVLAVGRA